MKGRRRKCSPPLEEMTVKIKQTKQISMPNSSAAFIGAERLEQLERHGCDSRENLVQLPDMSSWLEQRTLKTSGQILDLKLIKIRNYSSLLLLDYTSAAEAGI